MGRTGIVGRGLLGKWGPNHAVDPIVTRYVKQFDFDNHNNEDAASNDRAETMHAGAKARNFEPVSCLQEIPKLGNTRIARWRHVTQFLLCRLEYICTATAKIHCQLSSLGLLLLVKFCCHGRFNRLLF